MPIECETGTGNAEGPVTSDLFKFSPSLLDFCSSNSTPSLKLPPSLSAAPPQCCDLLFGPRLRRRHSQKMSEEKSEPGGPGFDDTHLEGAAPKAADDRFHFESSDLDRVQRRLKQRHVQMYVPLAYYAFIIPRIYRSCVTQDRRECLLLAIVGLCVLIIAYRLRGRLGQVYSSGRVLRFVVRVLWAHCSRTPWLAR
jgi:hypothetical protein